MKPLQQESSVKEKGSDNVVSAQQADEIKMKEKMKREREKKLPQKKRKRLEAARERMEFENEDDGEEQKNKKGKKEKGGIPLMDLGYSRAKAVKAKKRAEDSGKIGKARGQVGKKPKHATQEQARGKDEMEDSFPDSMNDKHSKRLGMRKASKNSFKSKSRYKRRK